MGFTWPDGHEASIIGMARIICDDLGWGWTPDRIAQDVHAELDQRGVNYGQVAAMVNLAHSTYYPNQRCWAATAERSRGLANCGTLVTSCAPAGFEPGPEMRQ